MGIIIWIIIGGIGGWLISTFAKHSSSNLIDIVFGLVGALSGAFIANNFIGVSQGSAYTFIAAGIGAFVFIFLGRLRAISR